MLKLFIPSMEFYDETNQQFINLISQTLHLEHSLASLSKWESKWHKPFFDKEEKTIEQSLDYIRCMTLDTDVDPTVYSRISKEMFDKVNAYIEDSMTATWFSEDKNKKPSPSRKTITAEILYYNMFSYGLPIECENWHLNRLITLMRVFSIKNKPPKKMSEKELYTYNRALNAERKARYNTKG